MHVFELKNGVVIVWLMTITSDSISNVSAINRRASRQRSESHDHNHRPDHVTKSKIHQKQNIEINLWMIW